MGNQEKLGIIYMVLAYLLWGVMPIYWKFLETVSSGEILAHRIVWSFVFMIAIIFLTRNWGKFITESASIIKDKGKFFRILLASLLISLNWLTFIWAVNTDHVVEASLGYYINPLISILLGMLVLKESLSRGQIASFFLAGTGVLYLTVSYGVFPWISFVLALSFAFYGLLKKTVQVPAMFGLAIETLFVTPIALLYLWTLPNGSFQLAGEVNISLLLIGAGIMTAVPLLLFGSGAKRIPLSMTGILQFMNPTIMLFIGVFVFREPFTQEHLIAFLFIWAALVIFMTSHHKQTAKVRHTEKI